MAVTISALQSIDLLSDLDGDGLFDPGETVTFTVTIENTGVDDAQNVSFTETLNLMSLVDGSINVSPIAFNDSGYNAVGNAQFTATISVLTNDTEPGGTNGFAIDDSTVLQNFGTPFQSTEGGTVTLNEDGTFTYTSATGFEGTDSFEYTLVDQGGLTSTGTVEVEVGPNVWFIDDSAAPGGDGSQANPFNSIAAFNAVNDGIGNNPGENDIIYLRFGDDGVYTETDGINLLNGQKLIGQGEDLVVTPTGGGPDFTLDLDNTQVPTIVVTGAGGQAIQLAQNNTIQGLNVGMNHANAIGIEDGGGTVGTLNISNVSFSSTLNLGQAIDIDQGGILNNVSFGSLFSSGSANQGVDLQGLSGSFTVSGGSISSAAGTAFNVATGSVNVTYSGTIANSAGKMISVQDTTGGAVTFNTGTANGLADSGSGTGILIDGAAGNVAINNASLTGAKGIEILGDATNNATGTFTFNNVAIDTTAGAGNHAFVVNGDVSGAAGDDVSATIDLNNVDITNPGGNVAHIQGLGGGSIDFDAASHISRTDGGAGILVTSNSGGTINFGGSSQVLSTGTNGAVNLTGNTNATINFTNGGLDIDTTSGTGFNATGGGTVTVTGAVNTINSGTGSALNVANTNIGAADLTFQTISTTGVSANPGIVLNNTGSLGGLTVTGTGTVAGSGGTISNKSGNGITLTDTRDVSLSNMAIQNNDGSGIAGTNVTNFSITGSTISDSGDSADGTEAGIRFVNLLGTSSINTTTFNGSSEDHVRITNSSGTLNLSVTDSTFNANSALTGGHGISVINTGASTATLTVSNTDFTDIRSTAVLMNLTDTATGTLNISGGDFTRIGAAVTMGTSASADLNFNVSGITSIDAISNAIQLVAGSASTTSSNIVGVISNNTIGDGSPDSGSRDMFGIALDMRGDQDAIISILNNNVQNTDFEGIWVSSADFGSLPGSGRLDLHLRDNTVGAPDDNSGFPIGFIRGVLVDIRHTTTAFLDISGNTSAGTGGAEGFRFRQRDTSQVFVERLSDGDATPGETITDLTLLQNFFNVQNDPGSTSNVTLATGFIEAADGAARDPLLAAEGGVAAASAELKQWQLAGAGDFNGDGSADLLSLRGDGLLRIDAIEGGQITNWHILGQLGAEWQIAGIADLDGDGTSDVLLKHDDGTYQANLVHDNQVAVTVDLALVDGEWQIVSSSGTEAPPTDTTPPSDPIADAGGDGGSATPEPHPVVVDDGVLSQAELDYLVAAAKERWAGSGLSAEQAAALDAMTFAVADLPGWQIASVSGGNVTLDADAFGLGWFVDGTPLDDAEFGNALSVTRL
ncbi:MAG TPA: Ig-like domain-containing protein, partial [Afifellaceae bacterium]|nr:Ig-like domain-containing protein [Afifellaceae bacterium]